MNLYALKFFMRRKFHETLASRLEEARYRWPRLQKRRFQRKR